MPKKQKRDNAYYEQRLKSDFPAIYADLKAGKHRTVTEALIAEGIRTPRTRLHELKNAFDKASKAEQAAFLSWLSARGHSIAATPIAVMGSSKIALDRRLLPAAKLRVEEIMTKRGLEMGEVMIEMGFSKLNPSLGRALHRGDRLQLDVITAIEKWLAANVSI